jgi:hypothetical protein
MSIWSNFVKVLYHRFGGPGEPVAMGSPELKGP